MTFSVPLLHLQPVPSGGLGESDLKWNKCIFSTSMFGSQRIAFQTRATPVTTPLVGDSPGQSFCQDTPPKSREQQRKFDRESTAEEVTDSISLYSKVIIVTGGSAGIGYETSRVLAKRGAHVVIACENLRAAEEAKSRILKETPNAEITPLHLNLGSMYSVKEFSLKFKSLGLPLHVLINNAGVASSHFVRSEDGFEMTFAVNHVGHFLLTNLLLDHIVQTARQSRTKGRIVIVSSSQHDSAQGIDFQNLHTRSWMFSVPVLQSVHGLSHVYAQSKLANILHAKELARRLAEEGKGDLVCVNALHPGVFNTGFVEKFALPAGLAFSWIEPLLKTVEQGAATTCYLAVHSDVEGVTGKYFSDCAEASGNRYTTNMKLARQLWKYTESLVKPYYIIQEN